MKNNKGFTLVELLAVIVILAIIIGIAIPAALSISHKMKVNMCKKKIEMVESAAKLYAEEKQYTGNVTVDTLLVEGYVKKDGTDSAGKAIVKNPLHENQPLNTKTVMINKQNRRYSASMQDAENICK